MQVEWNKDECKKRLKQITKAFLDILVILIHIMYDQPMRAEELAMILTKNQIYGIRGRSWSRDLAGLFEEAVYNGEGRFSGAILAGRSGRSLGEISVSVIRTCSKFDYNESIEFSDRTLTSKDS